MTFSLEPNTNNISWIRNVENMMPAVKPNNLTRFMLISQPSTCPNLLILKLFISFYPFYH